MCLMGLFDLGGEVAVLTGSAKGLPGGAGGHVVVSSRD